MNRFIQKIIGISLWPIMILNLFGSLVGGVWLLFLGEWGLVLYFFLLSIFSPYIISIVMMLQIPLAGLMNWLQKKGRKKSTAVTGFINMAFGHIVDLIWVVAILTLAISSAKEAGNSTIPYLLFSWGVATGPFQYMASQEPRDAIGSYVAVYLTQISFLIFAIFHLLEIQQFSLPLIILITLGFEVYLLKTAFKISDSNDIKRKDDNGSQKHKVNKKNVHPWKRYFARFIDITLFTFVAGIFVAVYLPTLGLSDTVFGFLILSSYIFVESLLLSTFGNTPGKWLFNIQLTKTDKKDIEFIDALKRSAAVWFRGLGMGLPVVNLVTLIYAYTDLKKEGKTSWDRDFNFDIKYGNLGFLRGFLFTIVLASFFVLFIFY